MWEVNVWDAAKFAFRKDISRKTCDFPAFLLAIAQARLARIRVPKRASRAFTSPKRASRCLREYTG